MTDSQTAQQWLGPSGHLERLLPNFSARSEQQQMAAAIVAALQQESHLLCEAPTGIGKTYGYLLPLLLQAEKAIISTGTKNLQDQLFHRDLPQILVHLGQGLRVAMLKGRSNYLCLYRLENAFSDDLSFSRKALAALQTVNKWAAKTRSGDISECSTLAEDHEIWPTVTSNSDNCLGQDCPLIGQCHLFKARKRAMDADIVVVNHHLLFADLAVKDEGFGELLPDAKVVVFDEAHQIPEIAAHFFSKSFTSGQVAALVRDILLEQRKEASDRAELAETASLLQASMKTIRQALTHESSRGTWQEFITKPGLASALEQSEECFAACLDELEEAAVRSKGLAHCYERAQVLLAKFKAVTVKILPENTIHWLEYFSKSFHIHLTPLQVAEPFQAVQQEQDSTWIFTSATLTTQQNFDYFRSSLGLVASSHELVLDTPFNYQQQALLYVPRHLPDARSDRYIDACVQAAIPVINACQGRTFFLFTSHRALQIAAPLLAEALDFPLFVQGEVARAKLLQQYRAAGNGVLLGTSSFWEGIDIQGEALSCVIIDKLPFASPADPVNRARIEAYNSQGLDAFLNYQLPKAVIMLKQGAGRLIRDREDQGVLMVCDSRLVEKPYGADFLKSLPSFTRTRQLSKVTTFMASWKSKKSDELKSNPISA